MSETPRCRIFTIVDVQDCTKAVYGDRERNMSVAPTVNNNKRKAEVLAAPTVNNNKEKAEELAVPVVNDKKNKYADADGAKKGLGDVRRASAYIEKVYEGEDSVACAAHLLKYGVSVSRPRVRPDFWNYFILSVASVVLNQPFKDEHKVVLKDERGEVLTPDKPGYLMLLKNNLSVAMRKVLRAGAALHVGFGAPCDVLVWHLACVWELRENPDLYNIAVIFLGTHALWVGINRVIWKLPGEGDDEFLHWDAIVGDMAFDEPNKTRDEVCGKCMATDTYFIVIPGSHTEEFHREFQQKYFNSVDGKEPLYVYKAGAKFALDAKKPDPMNLWARAVKVFVPAGCLVLWLRVCHGVIKNPTNGKIAIGTYIGFFHAKSNPNYEKVCGVNELADRLNSLKTGMPPQLYPSCDKVHKRPVQFVRNPPGLRAYMEKMVEGHPSITKRFNAAATLREGNDVWVPELEFHLDEAKEYKYPMLTELGEKLAGVKPWE